MRGRLFGVMAMAFFGACWAWLGLHTAHVATPLAIGIPAAGALALLAAAWMQRRRWIAMIPARPDRRLMGMAIGGEAVLLVVVANLIQHFHRLDLLAPSVAVVVGLHFLPLSRALRLPLYAWCGAAICLVGLAGLALAEPGRSEVVGGGCALALWTTTWLLVSGRAGANPDAMAT